MTFRARLSLFLLAILVLVQGITWAMVYSATRKASIAEGERQLSAAADAFIEQMEDVSSRIAGSVQVLSLDYPLRAAIAQRDEDTIWSALRNHGRRVGAERMLLLDLDGSIRTDTAHAPGDEPAVAPGFLFPGLLDDVYDHPVAAVVAIEGRAYWLVVVPVYAPQPVALIAAGIPIDDKLLQRLQRLSALPKSIELVASTGIGPPQRIARGDASLDLLGAARSQAAALPAQPALTQVGEHEFVLLSRPLLQSTSDLTVTALFGYSLDDALRPFREMTATWALLVALGLLLGAIGAWLLARGVARPLESLTAATARIESGDYSAPDGVPEAARHDEIGRLSHAFQQMSEAIRERESRIRHQAEHDAGSGLLNRPAALRRIDQQLSDQRGSTTDALLMIGLTRLPDIVKTFGHAVGDRLMQASAAKLQHDANAVLVARAGDSRLLLWLDNCSRDGAIQQAFRLREQLSEVIHDGDLRLSLDPAVGIAVAPDQGSDASVLAQRAEVALFEASALDEPVRAYDPARDPNRPERLQLMSELGVAIDGDGLALHYQPKLLIGTGRVAGAEGLVRWPHPLRGPIPPDQFVLLAEETGNIRRLTRWVLAAGIAEARRWKEAGRKLKLALNLSVRDLEDRELPRHVANLLAAHQVGGDALTLEVTESAAMRHPDNAIGIMRQLADLGITIAIDDFGVGQSSLTYLRRLPARELKIDQSFVRRLAENMEDRTIVRSIVELGHRLGFTVTAEGVEDRPSLDFLADVGCDLAQGYFIAKPMPGDAFAAFLDDVGRAEKADG